MVRTAQLRRPAFGFSHNGSGMMTTDIEKRAQFTVTTANYDNRLAANFSCDVIAGTAQLVNPRGELPGVTEDGLLFNFEKVFVGVPGRGNCGGFSERRVGIVAINDLRESVHRVGFQRLCRPMCGKALPFRDTLEDSLLARSRRSLERARKD